MESLEASEESGARRRPGAWRAHGAALLLAAAVASILLVVVACASQQQIQGDIFTTLRDKERDPDVRAYLQLLVTCARTSTSDNAQRQCNESRKALMIQALRTDAASGAANARWKLGLATCIEISSKPGGLSRYQTIDECVQTNSGGTAVGSAPPPSGGGTCSRDADCKGDRVCQGGNCVTPR